MADLQRLKKHGPASFFISPTARQVLEEGKLLLNMSFTAIMEEAVREWGETHLPSATLVHRPHRRNVDATEET